MQRHLSILAALFMGACSLAPDYLRPDLAFADQWKDSVATPESLPQRWWEQFNSPALNTLVSQALAHNNDLAAAVARIDQARADARIARATLFPAIDASAGYGRDIARSTSRRDDSLQAGVGVAYEVDLFGANRSGRDAAGFTLEATQFNREALALVVVTDVMNAYFSLLTTAEQQRIAQANLGYSNELLKILEAQFTAGRISALEVAQQKTSIANAQASIAALVREQEISRHQLAVLTGSAPQDFKLVAEGFPTLALPAITPTLPSSLLERRPDIRASEAQLKAANADIGAARAAFFPSLSIGLDASWLESGGTALVLTSSLLAPIFRGGELEGRLEGTKARKEELAANYRSTVLVAFQELSDALARVKSAELRSAAYMEAVKQSQEAYSLAKARYLNGAIDYQALLDTQRSLLASEDSQATVRLEQLQAVTNLYKALGGPAQD